MTRHRTRGAGARETEFANRNIVKNTVMTEPFHYQFHKLKNQGSQALRNLGHGIKITRVLVSSSPMPTWPSHFIVSVFVNV